MMTLVDMDELDLLGVFFAHWTDDTPTEEARDSLEMLIADAYDEYYGDTPEEEREEMCINPFWVSLALTKKNHNDIRKMTKENKKVCVDWVLADREKRRSSLLRTNTIQDLLGVDKPLKVLI